MADTTLPGLLRTGTHAARPAATAVGTGTLYSCSDHSLIYQSSGAAWGTWLTAAAPGPSGPLNNFTATAVPGVGDDSADGYSVGSQWLNTTTKVMFVCKAATLGAAVWHESSTNVVVFEVASGATAYVADASIPRAGAAMFRDIGGNSGAGILQWYRHGTYNSLNGVAVSNHQYEFRNTAMGAGGGGGFSWFIENNTAGGRLGCKSNGGYGRWFALEVMAGD